MRAAAAMDAHAAAADGAGKTWCARVYCGGVLAADYAGPSSGQDPLVMTTIEYSPAAFFAGKRCVAQLIADGCERGHCVLELVEPGVYGGRMNKDLHVRVALDGCHLTGQLPACDGAPRRLDAQTLRMRAKF